MQLLLAEKATSESLLNRLQAEDFRTFSLLQAGNAPVEMQTVSMTDEAELERLGAQGLGDTIYDDATDTAELADFLDEFTR